MFGLWAEDEATVCVVVDISPHFLLKISSSTFALSFLHIFKSRFSPQRLSSTFIQISPRDVEHWLHFNFHVRGVEH